MTYDQLANKLSLSATDFNIDVSKFAPLEGFNTAQLEVTVQRLTATNVKFTMVSNDAENWRDVSGSTVTITAEGYTLATKVTGLSAAWIRVKYEVTGASGITVVACGLNLSLQT